MRCNDPVEHPPHTYLADADAIVMSNCEGGSGRMKQLIVSSMPGRKGWYLCIEEGGQVHTLARFLSEERVEDFRKWVQQQGIGWKDERE